MPNSWVDIPVDGQAMDSYLTRPNDDERHPAIIVIQEVWGVNSHIQYVTDRLPAQGYVGLAPSMFHREGKGVIGMHEEMETAFARMGACTDAGIVADVKAAVAWLQQQPYVDPDRIGIVGFCFGGRVSFLAACTVPELKAASVFYGGRILAALGDGAPPIDQVGNINCPVLGLFGEEDQNPTPADVDQIEAAMQAAGKTYSFHMYPGCGHGFHCNARGSYRPESARDAWGKTMAWFDEHVKA